MVMPAYNAERTVGPAIRSVLAQTRADFELLVVDDGSTDGTRAVVEQTMVDPRVRLLSTPGRGPAAARNAALYWARGRYVCFLDSDDLYLPRYLDEMEQALLAHPGVGMAYPDAWVLSGRTGRIRKTSTLAEYPGPPDDALGWLALLIDYNVVHYMAMVPKAVLVEVGGFDERPRAAMDYELWLRIAARGYRAIRIDKRLGVYRETPGSITSQRALVNANLRKVYEIVAEEYELAPPLRAAALRQARAAALRAQSLAGGPSLRARLERGLALAREAALDSRRWYSCPPPELRSFLEDMGVFEDRAS
ncbi:MAG: glycosyl transferase family 2 [Thermoleophilia bacterium]